MKPSIPKGTRDFGPVETAKRNYIFQTIREVFQLYGFQPIETPALENLNTLVGKYGDEGDQLLFRLFPRGENVRSLIKKVTNLDVVVSAITNGEKEEINLGSNLLAKFSNEVCEEGLRYDLTVPFARFVVMHQNQITFPFKRYQIQPVWRADKPNKGRYREFFQCDADVVGSNSLLNEVELVGMTSQVFNKLGVQVKIKINNRKILAGIAEVVGDLNKMMDITIAMDKLDKIGKEKVMEEMVQKGLTVDAVKNLEPVLDFTGNTAQKLSFLKDYLVSSEIGQKGVEEVTYVLQNSMHAYQIPADVLELDITLARGLNYYTGAIFEVKVNDARSGFTGSISGGGRYDDLTGVFGKKDLSGVGISYGADRIYDVMEELNLFPEQVGTGSKLLFVNFGEQEQYFCLGLLAKLRAAGISAEIFPDTAKMKKQMGYADDKKIPFVALVGSEEMQTGIISLKDMASGVQEKLTIEEIITKLNK